VSAVFPRSEVVSKRWWFRHVDLTDVDVIARYWDCQVTGEVLMNEVRGFLLCTKSLMGDDNYLLCPFCVAPFLYSATLFVDCLEQQRATIGGAQIALQVQRY
jgi:hypothetical protein